MKPQKSMCSKQWQSLETRQSSCQQVCRPCGHASMRGNTRGGWAGLGGGCPSTAGAIPKCLGHGTDVPSRNSTQVSGLDKEEVESRRWVFYSTDGRT